MEATVHLPGEGEQIGGPSAVTIKATGEETGNSFYLGEVVVAPGFPGPPPHFHEQLHDMFYVLDGTLTMRLGEESAELRAGSFVCVPPGVAHTFSNRGPNPVRFLNFNTPVGENYMRDLGALLAQGSPSPEQIGRLTLRLPLGLGSDLVASSVVGFGHGAARCCSARERQRPEVRRATTCDR
jgi:mannose-6-phosphate isomerase-like protein (cupin superfamily)